MPELANSRFTHDKYYLPEETEIALQSLFELLHCFLNLTEDPELWISVHKPPPLILTKQK